MTAVNRLDRQIERDFELTTPDAYDVAYQWVNYARTVKGKVPRAVDLAQLIAGIGTDLTMQGAPELEIDILDQDWRLLQSGFFDPEQSGTLDKVEINYPMGSKYFWRLRQFSPQQGSPYFVQTYWTPRVVDDLMNLHGPFSASRGTRTRAQFLKMCVEKVKGDGYTPSFYSKQLDVTQPIANITLPTSATSTSSKKTSGPKGVGVSTKATKGLTVKGVPMTPAQAQVATTLLKVADKLNAGKVATEAMIYAAAWESNLNDKSGPNSLGYGGVLAGRFSTFGYDAVKEATAFLQGGNGYQEGGAIQLATKGTVGIVTAPGLVSASPITNPIEIAVRVEAPSIWPNNAYASEAGYPGDVAALKEVDAIIEAGGGASGVGGVVASSTEVIQNYNFAIGTSTDKKEDFWTGMNRLAQEVNWELVIDGDDVYYDSDRTLVRDQIADVITLGETVALTDWSYDWDKNLVVANFELVLECDPFRYRPADVLLLKKFGPASVGKSSVGLAGRWLTAEIQRNPGDIISTLTLVQPTAPLPEPAPTITQATTKTPNMANTQPGTALAAVAAAQRLSGLKIPYVYGGNHIAGGNTITKAATLRQNGMDCSSSVSWVLYQAGLFDGATPIVSEDFATYGDAGPGREITVWFQGTSHVFLEFNVKGIGHYQFNTHVAGFSGPHWAPWGPYGSTDAASGAFVARHPPGL